MNGIAKSLVDGFNEQNPGAVRLVFDDGDSFTIEIQAEAEKKFIEFIKKATGRTAHSEHVMNILSKKDMVRVFFEKSTASGIVDILREYEEGMPPHGLNDD